MSEFLSQSFADTLKEFNLTGAAIARKANASPSQISDFKNGNRNLSTVQLENVLVAMEELAPGSRLHFCLLAAGTINHKQLAVLLNSVANHLASSPSRGLAGTLT